MGFTLRGLPHYKFQIIMPLSGSISLGDLDLEKLGLCHVGSQPGERLTPAAAHTNQQSVSTWLLEDAGNAAHMLYGETKKHQIHRCLADVVEFLQVGLHHLAQLVQIVHLTVVAVFALRVVEVTEHEAAQVVLSDFPIMVLVQMLEELMEVFFQVTLRHRL